LIHTGDAAGPQQVAELIIEEVTKDEN